MKVLLQRVSSASVTVADNQVSTINQGLLLLVGYGKKSTVVDNKTLADKILNMRIFSNSDGKFDYSVLDIKGEILAVPQFTLYADTQKGRRPDFYSALEPEKAKLLFKDFLKVLRDSNLKVESGIFGADMKVDLRNSGPVTIMLGE